jgi:polyvinyl alcohol dehydrogenase (cytochrome)
MARGCRAVLAAVAAGAMLALLGSGVAVGKGLAKRSAAAAQPVTAAAQTAGTSWPTYGGGLGNTFADPTSPVTAATVSSLTFAWSARSASEVSANPIVSGGTVFFGTDGGRAEAVTRKLGDVRWTTTLDGSPIDGGMALDGGRLFAATSGGHVYALDPATGKILWTSPDLLNGLKDALRASPKVFGGVVYESLGGTDDDLHEQGGVVALDEATGQVLWRTMLVDYQGGGAAVFSPPAIIPQLGELVVGTGNPTPYPGNLAANGAVPAGNDPHSDSLVALSLKDGHILWATQTQAHDGTDLDFIAGPNVMTLSNGTIAVGDGEKSGDYYLMDAATGRLLWTANLTLPGMQTLIVATAAASGGRIYVGTMDVGPSGLWPENYQEPGVGRLVALDAESGQVLWSDGMPGVVASAPVVGDGVVLALSANGQLLGLDPNTGATLWQTAVPGQVWNAEAGLTLAGSTLLLPLANPGGVTAYALPAPSGPA